MTMLPILKLDDSAIPELILVVGDPNRLIEVADRLQDVKEIGRNREYHSITGYFKNKKLAAVSHGVGSAGAGACFEELCRGGAKKIIRAGSAGGLQRSVNAGDLVIARAAVREDGLSPKLVPLSYPALATPDLVISLREAAISAGIEYHEGLVLTSDMFYPHDALGSDLPVWQRAGVTAVEMEAATLFVVCNLHSVETAAVLAIDGNPLDQDGGSMETYNPRQESVKTAVASSIEIALSALTA